MNLVIIGVLALLFIAFLVFIWKAAKDWRWYNLVALVITMMLSITFIFPTACALKSRAAWHNIKETLEVRADQAVAETKTLKYGDPNDASAGPGVIELGQELAKLGIEAGRRWRGLRMANNNVQSIQLNQPAQAAAPGVPVAADPAAADAPAPVPAGPLIPDGMVVYGFSEAAVPGVEGALPTFFLGEFRVTASTPTSVTLTPTGPLESAQQQRISGGQAASWSVYELLPLDAHDPFVAEGSSENEDNLFGRIDEDLVRGLLGVPKSADDRLEELQEKEESGAELTEPEQQELTNLIVRVGTVREYLDDGGRSSADQNRWLKIEFTKTFTLDVDSPQKTGALEGGFFDGNGRALDSRLQRGEDGNVKFKASDRIVVKEDAAKQLNLIGDDGVARLIDAYYVRPLNDYRFVLRRIRLRLIELSIRTKELAYEYDVLNAALAATVSMLTTNQTEKQKLEQDLAQTQAEATAIREYHQQVQADVKKTRETLVRLYQENQQLEQRLRKVQGSVFNSAQ